MGVLLDGSGKYFMLGPTSPRAPATDIRMGALKIKYRDWSAFVTQEHETSKGNTYDAVKKLYSVILAPRFSEQNPAATFASLTL